MTSQLVTVASFDQPAQAHVAKNVLEAAGIRSVVTDEETVGVLWQLSIALGGVKVQVMEEDAERAVAVLEKELDSDGKVDPEQLAAEAEAAGVEEGAEPPEGNLHPTTTTTTVVPGEDEDSPPSERDEYARRGYLAGLIGLVMPLLSFYALYLLLNAGFGEGPLSPAGRSKLRVGVILTSIGLFIALLIFMLL